MSAASSRGFRRRVFQPRILELFSRGYSRADLASDAMAGVTVGLIALPLGLALGIASIPAGIATPQAPPALGLFTAIIAGFLIAVLGGSRVQIGGPTAAFVPIILLIVSKHGFGGLLTATMMAGVILVVMGITRMGSLIKFIPWPVTSGFTTGIAVSIMASQLPDFLGVRSESQAPGEFLGKLHWLGENAGHTHLPSLLIALGCIATIGLWPRLGIRRIPGSVVAMVAATLLVFLTGWGDRLGIATIGSKFGPFAIPNGLPPLHWPSFEWHEIRDLIGPATAIAMLGAIESLLSAVVADGLTSDRHNSNTELIAQGAANLICPLFCGLPATGAIARTSANVANGAKSPVAGVIHSLTLFAIILVFSRGASFVPTAAMSAVLVMVAFRMGEWHEFRRLHLMPRSDAVVLLTTFALTVVFDLVVAVEVGMVLAAILFIRRVSETTEISRVTTDDVLESREQLAAGKSIPHGVVAFRVFGPFLFGAAEKMEDAMEALGDMPRVLILRLHLVSAMDATGLNTLESVIERFRHHGGTVILSGLHRQPLDMIRKAGLVTVIGRKNLCAHFDAALARANALLATTSDPP